MKKPEIVIGSSGFTLIEMVVVVFLLTIAMLGLLAVFDAGARINKSETEVADAQGNVRFGLYQMTRVIRMAGSGGMDVRQAVLRQAPGAGLPGITPPNVSYDNVPAGTRITDTNSKNHVVRPGTDMIEIRGVILSPLYGLMGSSCGTCMSMSDLVVPAQTGNPVVGVHYNDDAANRPQFTATVSYTTSANPANPMFVLVAATQNQSSSCVPPPPPGSFPSPQIYPMPIYNVALLDSPASVSAGALKFSNLKFDNNRAKYFNGPDPSTSQPPSDLSGIDLLRGGVLDDILYFVDDGVSSANVDHPALVAATRRGDAFDMLTVADDVEDMQIAYGVDINVPPDGLDPTTSTAVGGDEWTPNVSGEDATGIPSFVSAGTTCPTLHGVMISLLSKSRSPDPTYKAPAATGFRMMNVPLAAGIPITAVSGANYRRRIQTLRITLRNYAFEEQ